MSFSSIGQSLVNGASNAYDKTKDFSKELI